MLRRLKIDPEFQSKIPPLTFEELNLLETNILEEGRILNPLIVWNGLIVDGHNRFAILKNHPEIKYTVLEKEFANRYEAIVWICRNQLGRRNLTLEQKKYLVGKQYEAEKKMTPFQGNQYTLVRQSGADQIDPHQKLSEGRHQTRARIAKDTNTSEGFVQRAEKFARCVDVAEEAIPGTRAKILSGEVKPTAAELAAVSHATPEERPALVAELCKPKERKMADRKEKKAASTIVRAKAEEPKIEASGTCEPAEPPPAPSSELAPKPVKIDNQQLLEIAASRYHAKRLATGSDMLCEIKAAADNLKERWEQTFRYYPDLFTDPDNRAAVGKIVRDLMNYLKRMEERTE